MNIERSLLLSDITHHEASCFYNNTVKANHLHKYIPIQTKIYQTFDSP